MTQTARDVLETIAFPISWTGCFESLAIGHGFSFSFHRPFRKKKPGVRGQLRSDRAVPMARTRSPRFVHLLDQRRLMVCAARPILERTAWLPQ